MAMIHDVRCANARFSPWRVAGRGRHRSANHLGPGRRAAALLWLGAALLAAPAASKQKDLSSVAYGHVSYKEFSGQEYASPNFEIAALRN